MFFRINNSSWKIAHAKVNFFTILKALICKNISRFIWKFMEITVSDHLICINGSHNKTFKSADIRSFKISQAKLEN